MYQGNEPKDGNTGNDTRFDFMNDPMNQELPEDDWLAEFKELAGMTEEPRPAAPQPQQPQVPPQQRMAQGQVPPQQRMPQGQRPPQQRICIIFNNSLV